MHDPTEVLPRRREQSKDADPMLGRVVDGRYRLRRLLGRGAMGAVYGARHEITDRDVAVKLIPSPLDARAHERRQRFFREVRAPARIHHRAMVEVVDAGESEGMLYLVMELLEGEDLSQILARGPVPWSTLQEWIEEVLDALSAAHAAGFVHRDIKPANIFICRDDNSVKLLDFGVVKQDGASLQALTADGMIIGTPWYMSPEQAAAEDSGPATDIWAVGAVMFHSLSGEPPVDGEKPIDTISAIVRGDVRRLGDMDSGAPQRVCDVVDRAMAATIEQRYPSARAMKDALRSEGSLGAAPVSDDGGHSWVSSNAAVTAASIDTANIPHPGALPVKNRSALLGALAGAALTLAGVLLLGALTNEPNPIDPQNVTAGVQAPGLAPSPKPETPEPAKPEPALQAVTPVVERPPDAELEAAVRAVDAPAPPAETTSHAAPSESPVAQKKPSKKPARKRRASRKTNRKRSTATPPKAPKNVPILRDYE